MFPLILAKRTFTVRYTVSFGFSTTDAVTKREERLLDKSIAYLRLTGELPCIQGEYVIHVTTDILGSIDQITASAKG